MKFLSAIIGCVMAVMPLCAHAENKHEGAHMKFEHTKWDFGNISIGGENEIHTFRFVNDGTEPLVVFATVTSCQCIRTEFSRKPLAVGESGEIQIVVDTKKLDEGIFHRIIQVRSNSTGGTENLIIEGVAKDNR